MTRVELAKSSLEPEVAPEYPVQMRFWSRHRGRYIDLRKRPHRRAYRFEWSVSMEEMSPQASVFAVYPVASTLVASGFFLSGTGWAKWVLTTCSSWVIRDRRV